MSESKTPNGVVGVLTGPDGYVWASVSDFDSSGYGGFSLQEAQTRRVKQALALKFLDSTCNDIVVSVLDPHRCEEIVWALCSKKGFKRTIIPVGYEDPS